MQTHTHVSRYQSIRRTITNDSRPEEQPANELLVDETDTGPSMPGDPLTELHCALNMSVHLVH